MRIAKEHTYRWFGHVFTIRRAYSRPRAWLVTLNGKRVDSALTLSRAKEIARRTAGVA